MAFSGLIFIMNVVKTGQLFFKFEMDKHTSHVEVTYKSF